jgi:O-antigen/teichoic acid export membrane protein
MKATSLLGGVQVINIIIGMIRIKFVAVLLGTIGVGIMGLLNAPLQLLISITGLGISVSAIREISEAHGAGNITKISRSILVLRRWSWFTGLLGVITTIILSPLLSQWAFGNKDYTWAFICLSITLLLQALSKGQAAILQGTRKLTELSKSSVLGTVFGLFTAIPLFYILKEKGIVPSLIAASLTTLILSWYFSRRIKIEKIDISLKETFVSGKSMVRLGMMMTLTVLLGSIASYVLVSYVGRIGGISQVGLYNSGWSIIGQYTGLIFTAMVTDYFPRLTAINQDNKKVKGLINQQAEMVTLILTPLLILLIIVMPIIIRLLYSPAFLPIVMFANWTVFGIFLKGIVWPIGFIFPAKGDLKFFGIVEITSMIFSLGVNILGYHLWSLQGLGISFIINYLFSLILTYYFANRNYEFNFEFTTIKLFVISALLILFVFASAYFLGYPYTYILGSIVLLFSVGYSLVSLQTRVQFLSLVRKNYK